MESYKYLDFENKFRGSRDSILSSLSHYDPLINTLLDVDPSMNILDIGCGRGEFLQRYSSNIVDLQGIEKDKEMVDVCKKNKIKVTHGDALQLLKDYPNESFSVISAFHVIEHMTRVELLDFVSLCERILKPNGVLILETPSIDNLIVSTKLFYLDETHVNHINPDGLAFSLERIGFNKVKYFLINGGPLQLANPLNLTRVLNGVAQDLLIIACKNELISSVLFSQSITWQSKLRIAPSTLESASDFDLEMYRNRGDWIDKFNTIEERITELKYNYSSLQQDLIQLRREMRYLRKIKDILLQPYRLIKKLIALFSTIIFELMIKVLNKLLSYRIILECLSSKQIKKLLFHTFSILPRKIGTIFLSKIYNKIDKFNQTDHKSKNFNRKLLDFYDSSSMSKYYMNLLNKRIKFK